MLRIRGLGTAEIDAGRLRITPGSPRKFALLLRLAADADRLVPRNIIRELIFPDLPEKNANHSLRDLAYQIRQAGVGLESSSAGLMLHQRGTATDYGDLVVCPAPTLHQLRAAQSGFLPGYCPTNCEAFSEWLDSYRAHITIDLCRAISKAIARAKSVGDWTTTREAARACLELDPSHEEATLALAEVLAATGSKVRAVELLDDYAREVGARSIGLEIPAQLVKRRIADRVPTRAQSGLTLPFVGREVEMLSLRDRFDAASRGEAQCIAIVGDAGIGKSRLAEEFCTQAALHGAIVEHVAPQPHDKHRPMAVFADLVPRLLKLPGALGCSPISLTALSRLTGLEDTGSTGPSAIPEAVAATISRALADLIDSIASESKLVLLIDDVQWVDELSRSTLSALASSKSARRLIVVLTSRDREILTFFGKRTDRLLPIYLSPLGQSALHKLLERLNDPESLMIDSELQHWIALSSGGNPFFVRCLVAHYQATEERFVIPSSLSALLDQQLLALNSDALSVLSMSAALGRHSTIEHLVSALQIPHIQLQGAIRDLELSNLLILSEERITPAHWLITEAVGRAISPIATTLLHRRVAEVLELAAGLTHSGGTWWDCAEHWILAKDPARALCAMRTCANYLIEIGRPREAAEQFFRAVSLTDGKERREMLTRAFELAEEASELDLVLRCIDTARKLGISVDSPTCELTEIFARIGARQEGGPLIELLRGWLTSPSSFAIRLRAGLGMLLLADYCSMTELANEVYDSLRPEISHEREVGDIAAMTFLLIYHASFGEAAKAVEICEALWTIGDNLHDIRAVDIKRKCAVALIRVGEAQRAAELLAEAYRTAESYGLIRTQCLIAIMQCDLLSNLGDDEGSARTSAIAISLGDQMVDDQSAISYFWFRTGRACTVKDLSTARHWLSIVKSQSISEPSERAERWRRSLEMRVAQLEGDFGNADDVVREMTAYHRTGREGGDLSDYEIAVAMRALLADHRKADAAALLDNYLKSYRRVRGALERDLQDAAILSEWSGDSRYLPAHRFVLSMPAMPV
jgi:DNA-binding SARP family transcriptional activator